MGDPGVVLLLLVDAEGLEECLLRREPPVESRPRDPGGGRNVRKREPPSPRAGKDLDGRLQDALPGRCRIELDHALHFATEV